MEGPKIDCNEVQENLQQQCYMGKANSIFFSQINKLKNFDLSRKFWKEISLKATMNIPIKENDIEQIDSIASDINILETKLIKTPDIEAKEEFLSNYENKRTTGRILTVNGFVILSLSYISVDKSKSVQNFSLHIPFSSFIVMSKNIVLNNKIIDSSNINFEILSCIEDINIKSLKGFKISLNLNLILLANPLENKNFFSSKEARKTNIDFPKLNGICKYDFFKNLLLNNLDYMKYWNEISETRILKIPSYKPNVKQILSLDCKIKVINSRPVKTPLLIENNFSNNKITGNILTVDALLYQKICYISNETSKISYVYFTLPISSYITLPFDQAISNKYSSCIYIEDIFINILNSREVFTNIVIFLKTKPIKK